MERALELTGKIAKGIGIGIVILFIILAIAQSFMNNGKTTREDEVRQMGAPPPIE